MKRAQRRFGFPQRRQRGQIATVTMATQVPALRLYRPTASFARTLRLETAAQKQQWASQWTQAYSPFGSVLGRARVFAIVRLILRSSGRRVKSNGLGLLAVHLHDLGFLLLSINSEPFGAVSTPTFTSNRLAARPFGDGDDLLTNLEGKRTLTCFTGLGNTSPFALSVLRSSDMLDSNTVQPVFRATRAPVRENSRDSPLQGPDGTTTQGPGTHHPPRAQARGASTSGPACKHAQSTAPCLQ